MVTVLGVLSPAGWTSPIPDETVLYSFLGGSDGASPFSLIAGRDGALYGTTGEGGTANDGTVFELSLYTGKRDRFEKEQRDRKRDQLDRDGDSIFPISE
jgi:uncharacterized repeat protein (TIGR03803 family)